MTLAMALTPTEAVNPTRMVHKVWNPADMVAMCGAPLVGIFYPPDVCDCIVCAEIERQRLAGHGAFREDDS